MTACAIPWCCCVPGRRQRLCAVHLRDLALGVIVKSTESKTFLNTGQACRPLEIDGDEFVVSDSADLPACIECRGRMKCVECNGRGEHRCDSSHCGNMHECGACDGQGVCAHCEGTGVDVELTAVCRDDSGRHPVLRWRRLPNGEVDGPKVEKKATAA